MEESCKGVLQMSVIQRSGFGVGFATLLMIANWSPSGADSVHEVAPPHQAGASARWTRSPLRVSAEEISYSASEGLDICVRIENVDHREIHFKSASTDASIVAGLTFWSEDDPLIYYRITQSGPSCVKFPDGSNPRVGLCPGDSVCRRVIVKSKELLDGITKIHRNNGVVAVASELPIGRYAVKLDVVVIAYAAAVGPQSDVVDANCRDLYWIQISR